MTKVPAETIYYQKEGEAEKNKDKCKKKLSSKTSAGSVLSNQKLIKELKCMSHSSDGRGILSISR